MTNRENGTQQDSTKGSFVENPAKEKLKMERDWKKKEEREHQISCRECSFVSNEI